MIIEKFCIDIFFVVIGQVLTLWLNLVMEVFTGNMMRIYIRAKELSFRMGFLSNAMSKCFLQTIYVNSSCYRMILPPLGVVEKCC